MASWQALDVEKLGQRRAWLLMAAGENRGHGGHSGYDDQYDAYYSWDSNVPNHKNLQVGDPIALWDKVRLLGISVIEQIDTSPGQKVLNRCPECGTTRISLRKRATPRYRCMKCGAAFEAARADVAEVELYTARYDAAWTSLEGVLDEHEVRAVQTNAVDINAMRPLNWDAFRDALARKDAGRALSRVQGRLPDSVWSDGAGVTLELSGGFRRSLVRVRRGQRQFRAHLLSSQGSTCAFTGGAPERVLDAGHLYSYARLGEHHAHGGLMLRRDIHRLFDDGMLAVDPITLRIDVDSELAAFPQYACLDGRPLQLDLREQQVDWLGKHWGEHRATASRAP